MPVKKKNSDEDDDFHGLKSDFLPATVSTPQLCLMLNLSKRSVSDYGAKGVLVQATRGRWQTLPSIQRYCDHVRQRAASHVTDSGISLVDERAKFAKTTRAMAELKLAKMRGEVLTIDEVTEAWGQMMQATRINFMSLPGKARQQLSHLTAYDAQVLKRLCVDVLTAIAEEVEQGVVGAGDVPDE